jgi:GxxExxY protein
MKHSKYPDLGDDLTKIVIGAAISVHKAFGPGLDEADYERALHLELLSLGVEHECQVPLPLIYKGVQLDCGYRMDLVLAGRLLLELKVVDKLHPLHEAQLLTYLRLSQMSLGLLMNFNVLMLRDGIVRRANTIHKPSQPLKSPPPAHGFDALSETVLAAAREVKHVLGTGLLRSSYETCLAHELTLLGIKVARGLSANLLYREQIISSKKQVPLLVDDRLMIACHCVNELNQLQLARDRSLLKAAGAETGLSINFHSDSLATEIRRIRPSC